MFFGPATPSERTQRKFRIVIGDQLALTPPMGWSSWDFLQTEVTDREVRAQADAMVRSGLVNYGYSYINIDDGWSVNRAVRAPEGLLPRDAAGNIKPNRSLSGYEGLDDLSTQPRDEGGTLHFAFGAHLWEV